MIIPKISDVLVSISLEHPQNTAGLNTTAIYVSGVAESKKTYFMLEDVAADYASGSSVLNLATTIFDQDASPDAIQVYTYPASSGTSQAPAPSSTVTSSGSTTSTTPASSGSATNVSAASGSSLTGIAKAAYDYFYEPWDYAILADYNKADALALADIIENGGDDGKGFHLLFLQFDPSNYTDSTAFANYTRTWTYYHDVDGESIVAALCGEAGAQDTGKASWEFVSNLADVTPVNNRADSSQNMTATQIEGLESQNLIMYVQKGTFANFTSAVNASGNYVDVYAGEDWVKANLESAIQNALADVNGSGRVSFNANGIKKVGAVMDNVLDTAFAQGIIAVDATTGKAAYTTTLPTMDEVKGVELSRRILNRVKFDYHAASEIAKVNVKGTAIAY